MKKITLNRTLAVVGTVAALIAAYFVFWFNKKIDITGSPQVTGPASALAGQPCKDYARRPIAVMLASDPEARPLSGVAQADMVFEMPVAPDGITRMMAVFQCRTPKEIGSIRSARQDFIPLAAGLKAIFAHWGGERDALENLNSGILDNIDALKLDGTVFYRKPKVHPPHNGFTTIEKLTDFAKQSKYAVTGSFPGYSHSAAQPERNLSNITDDITVDYPGPYKVEWKYDAKSNSYKRWRGGEPEADIDSGTEVRAAVVILMKTRSQFIRDQYVRVNVAGQGEASVYQNGVRVDGTWKKDAADVASKLFFYDTHGKEVEFPPGAVWVELVTE